MHKPAGTRKKDPHEDGHDHHHLLSGASLIIGRFGHQDLLLDDKQRDGDQWQDI